MHKVYDAALSGLDGTVSVVAVSKTNLKVKVEFSPPEIEKGC